MAVRFVSRATENQAFRKKKMEKLLWNIVVAQRLDLRNQETHWNI